MGLNESRCAAPRWPGATSKNIGYIRPRSNAASGDAPPGSRWSHYVSRGLGAVVALIILAAAAPPRAAEKVPFAVHTRGLTFSEMVASLTVLRGAKIDL